MRGPDSSTTVSHATRLFSQPPAVCTRILGEFGDLDTVAATYTEEEAAVMLQVYNHIAYLNCIPHAIDQPHVRDIG